MSDPVTQVTWPPDRKIWAGGLSGLIVAVIVFTAGHFGYTIPPDLQAVIPVLFGYIVSYLMPPSMQDVIKRVDDTVIAIARASNESPASAKAPAITPAVAAAVQSATGVAPAKGT